jgi:hypothetical protein
MMSTEIESHRWRSRSLCIRYAALATCAICSLATCVDGFAASVSTHDLGVAVIDGAGQCSNGLQNISFFGADSVPDISCTGATFSLAARANAQFGALRGLADLRFNSFDFKPDTQQANFEAKAVAGFRDTLTISSGSFLELTAVVEGLAVATNSSVNNGQPFSPGQAWCLTVFGGGCFGGSDINELGKPRTYTVPIPSSRTITLQPSLTIDLVADLRRSGDGSPPPGLPLTSDTYVDILNTARFGSARVLDANGLPISAALIQSESGFDYTTPVPEPAVASMLMLGLACLGLLRGMRHSGWFPRHAT